MSLGENAAERLRDIGLFGGLSAQPLHDFGGALELLTLAPEAVVYREGDTGREMFVVLSGELSVVKLSRRNHEMTVRILRPGEWFGEMSMLDVMPRSATVKVTAETELLRVTAHDLDALYRRDLKSYTLLVLNIAREMSRQRRVTEGMLTELLANMSDEFLTRR
jgi:CRP/FNR family transcriptional regulator, cyclic AMP receptor protein